MIRCAPLIALCLLTACDGGDSTPNASAAITPSEAKALQEAAEMIPPPAASASPAMSK